MQVVQVVEGVPEKIDVEDLGGKYDKQDTMSPVFDDKGSNENLIKSPTGCGLSGVQVQDKYGSFLNDDGPPGLENARVIMELQEQISTVEIESKLRDDKHAREIGEKDELIANLNETILKLLAENDDYYYQLVEPEVHAMTQSVKTLSAEENQLQRTLVKNLKAKTRKGTEREDYVYTRKSKQKDPVEPDAREGNKGVVDVEKYEVGPEGPGSKPEPLKDLKGNRVHQKMTSEDRTKLAHLWNRATNRYYSAILNLNV